jgi:hypothetical protein
MSALNSFYPCDGLPNTATPAMEIVTNEEDSPWTSDSGLLHMVHPYSASQTDVAWWGAWKDLSPTTLEFEVSFPRMEYLGVGWEQLYCRVYTASMVDANHQGVVFDSFRALATDEGEQVVLSQGFQIFTRDVTYLVPAPHLSKSSWTGKIVVKNPVTHLVDVYLNDVLVIEDTFAIIDQAAFNVQMSGMGDGYVDLDYFNAYIDRPTVVPTVHSFPWVFKFQLTHKKV